MNKGLKTTLLAAVASLAGISSSYAAAPVIGSIPDICIGDADDNIGATDNNYFVFTNAFRFDDVVSDADTADSALLWSFDEGDNPDNAADTTAWFNINGKAPVHVGALAQAGDTSQTLEHLSPASANELRSVSDWASFRDVVLSPGSGGLTTGFNPSAADIATHQKGKTVTLWVSDGSTAVFKDIVVKVVDDAADAVSGASYVPEAENEFAAGAEGWVPSKGNNTNETAAHVTSNNGELRATAVSAPASMGDTRIIGWLESNAADTSDADNLHLTYDEAGSNWVRAKFHMYATGQPTSNKNEIPNLRLRVTSRFAFGNVLDVLHHNNAFFANTQHIADDLTPSTDAANPSVYKVDFVPPSATDVPYLNGNTTEGIQRMWEIFVTGYDQPVGRGSIAMTESSIGVYPAQDLTAAAAKVYTGADFASTNIHYQLDTYARGALTKQQSATNAPITASGHAITVTGSSTNGVTADTGGVNDTVIGIAAIDWLNGSATSNDTTLANRLRVEAGKQYLVSFRATSTRTPTTNSWIRFRTRTVRFSYNTRLEADGPWNSAVGTSLNATDLARPTHTLAQQFAPTSTPKWYHVPVTSPIDPAIGSQPDLTAQPGPGVESASLRDLFIGLDIIDSISGAYWTTTGDFGEKGNVTVDRVEIRVFDQVQD